MLGWVLSGFSVGPQRVLSEHSGYSWVLRLSAATTEEAVEAAGRQQQRIRTKGMLEMRAMQQDRKEAAEKAEDKAGGLRKSLVESLW